MINTKITVILFLMILTACSVFNPNFDGPDVKMKRRINDGRIIVTGFTVEGKNLPSDTGEQLKSRLFDLVFIETGLYVINKESITDSIEVKYELEGSLVHSSSGLNFDTDAHQKLSMSLRVVDAESREIIGVITSSCKYKSGVQEKINDLLEMCVDELKEFR